jgi:hypothetical protein
MAEDKVSESPEQDTSNTTRFPEAEGKIVQSIEVHVAADHYGIDINFTDNTAIVLGAEASLTVFPNYGDWTTGERKIIKEWTPIKSISLRT